MLTAMMSLLLAGNSISYAGDGVQKLKPVNSALSMSKNALKINSFLESTKFIGLKYWEQKYVLQDILSDIPYASEGVEYALDVIKSQPFKSVDLTLKFINDYGSGKYIDAAKSAIACMAYLTGQLTVSQVINYLKMYNGGVKALSNLLGYSQVNKVVSQTLDKNFFSSKNLDHTFVYCSNGHDEIITTFSKLGFQFAYNQGYVSGRWMKDHHGKDIFATTVSPDELRTQCAYLLELKREVGSSHVENREYMTDLDADNDRQKWAQQNSDKIKVQAVSNFGKKYDFVFYQFMDDAHHEAKCINGAGAMLKKEQFKQDMLDRTYQMAGSGVASRYVLGPIQFNQSAYGMRDFDDYIHDKLQFSGFDRLNDAEVIGDLDLDVNDSYWNTGLMLANSAWGGVCDVTSRTFYCLDKLGEALISYEEAYDNELAHSEMYGVL